MTGDRQAPKEFALGERIPTARQHSTGVRGAPDRIASSR